MKIITMYNNKGGVGKTTSVINIAYFLSKMGKKILVMDFDEQRNSSRFFSEEKPVNEDNEQEIAPITTRYANISLLTYDKSIDLLRTIRFHAVAAHSVHKGDFESQYAEWLKSNGDYDYIIFDLPPALNELTYSMLGFCDYVFVPIELGTFAIQGITVVVDTLSKITAKFGGCFVVKFDNENPSDYSLLDVLKNALGAKVLTSIIPFSRVIKNSISYRMTAAEYMDYMPAAEKYSELAKKIDRICEG
ncbi:MAG: ParA family protein [Eubacterium sp.]|nr:ParA family protein [Eubacterium sp.]